MAIADDIKVDESGNIIYVGPKKPNPGDEFRRQVLTAAGKEIPPELQDKPANTYSVVELHRYLQDLADDLPGNGSVIDVTKPNPSVQHSGYIIELNEPYHLDDDAAEFLRDGSIIDDGGNTVYTHVCSCGVCGKEIK